MSWLTSFISFANPVFLLGLLALPALYFLLKATPPPPRRIFFPALKFLRDITPQQQEQSRMPWWLLALRITLAALIILALAAPIINPREGLPGHGALRMIISNGWESAAHWDEKIVLATSLLEQAQRENRPVILQATASELPDAPMPAEKALKRIASLAPMPWGETENFKSLSNIYTIWLSDGIHSNIKHIGNADIYAPEFSPALLSRAGGDLRFTAAISAGNKAPQGLKLIAISKDGRALESLPVTFENGAREQTLQLSLSPEQRSDLAKIELRGQGGNSAGSVILIDANNTKRSAAILGDPDLTTGIRPGSEIYYLSRALKPFADITVGGLNEILNEETSLLIWPGQEKPGLEALEEIDKWVEAGGTLLRFAAEDMEQELLPAPLRSGQRGLQGALTWETPLHLAPPPETSPLYGLDTPKDVTVKRQLLATPAPDLSEKTWLALEDGTPLITADTQGSGRIILVHVPATPEWSDFVLSGLFIQTLQRITKLSRRGVTTQDFTVTSLEPIKTLNGYGALQNPPDSTAPLQTGTLDSWHASPDHPPGLYGSGGNITALNIGDTQSALDPLVTSLTGTYNDVQERSLAPILFALAAFLFLLDWLAIMGLQNGWRKLATLSSLLIFLAAPAHAQDKNIAFSNDIFLAYVQSGDPAVDSITHQALENLGRELLARTSVEPAGVTGVNLFRDDLSLFPLIYWPLTGNERTLAPEQARRVQHYLDHGGMILFDTREPRPRGASDAMKTMLSGLTLPQIEKLPEEHVLLKSFYLLDELYGGNNFGEIWVQRARKEGQWPVSPIIIANNDFAGIWAGTERGRKREMAIRSGVNIMMYALTGNYKADQVHMQTILERLGE